MTQPDADSGARPRRSLTLRTSGPDDTRALAGSLSQALRPGDVVALTGELGAGKTCFVQGAAAALGVEDRVTSPTFTLVRSYRGHPDHGAAPVDVVHVDVYRLERLQDVLDLGEDTIMGPDQITFIEWGDAVEALLPRDRLEVELHLADDPASRILWVRGHGRWADRVLDLAGNLMTWMDEAPPDAGRP